MLIENSNLEIKAIKNSFTKYYLDSYQSHRLFNSINDTNTTLKEKLTNEVYYCLQKNIEIFFDSIKDYNYYYNNIYQDIVESLNNSIFNISKKHSNVYLENQNNLKISKNTLVFHTHRNNKAQFKIVYQNDIIQQVLLNKIDLYNKKPYVFKEDFSYDKKEMKIFLDLFIVDSVFKLPEINNELNKKIKFYNTLIKSLDKIVLYNKDNFNNVQEIIKNIKLNDSKNLNDQIKQFQEMAELLYDKKFFNIDIAEKLKENLNKN